MKKDQRLDDRTDDELVRLAQKYHDAFQALYERYHNRIYNYFWYRTRHNADLSEDLTQDVFMKAFQHIDSYESRGFSYLTYLLRIAHNRLINSWRDGEDERIDEDVEEMPDPEDALEHIENAEELAGLWHEVQKLPLKERDLILLKYRKDKSMEEIAHITGQSVGAVKVALSRARKKLAKIFNADGIAKLENVKTSTKFIELARRIVGELDNKKEKSGRPH
jgi:RNA polymerase sigma-70 factor (ECF subfamily)